MEGVHNQIELPAPVDYDVGHLSDEEAAARGIRRLPNNLPDALAALEADDVIAKALGSIILPEFLKVRRAELAAYNLHVHPWERKLYLETV